MNERNGENGVEPEDVEEIDDADEPAEGDDASEEDEAGEGPAPATWAGRRHWEGLPSSGLTEEFDEVERQMAEGLDEEDVEEPDEGAAEEDTDSPDEEAAEDDSDSPDEVEELDEAEQEPAAAEPEPGETIEADTPALVAQEEAREKAMAGLKARTAEGQAKRGVTEPEGPAAEDETEVEEKPAEPEAEEAPAPVAAAVAEAEPAADQQKPPRSWLWTRFVTASFLIIVSMATATSVSLLVYLTDIAKGLGGLDNVQGELTSVEGGEPQNFLILGSDVRPDEEGRGRSDTAILLRIDPNSDVISMLSIPRDLRTNIPGHGLGKFNDAYYYGGPPLTTRTVKDLTDDRIPINHVVNVDFNGFADAVDAIGCVYIDVDRHYFHSNEGIAPGSDDFYAEIDVEAGYQRLCGLKALQYVRYRHEDNDLVRAARQQSFLREARAQVPPSKLLDERTRLIDIFTNYTDSDIDEPAQLVDLFKLMLGARGAQINRVEFQAASLNEGGYVTASNFQNVVSQFLNGGEEPPPEKEQSQPGSGDGKNGKSGTKGKSQESKEPPKPAEGAIPRVDLIDSTGSGELYANALAEDAGNEIKFPIAYPARIVPGSEIIDDTRWFRIDGPGNDIYRGYKFVMPLQTDNGTEYYGVSGTNWVGAPLFANASEERKVGGRTYKLYYDSGLLRMVAFQKGKAMYWVANTLDKALSNEQMLALAQYIAVPGG